MNTLKKSIISVALTASLAVVSNNAISAVLPDFVVDPDMASPLTTFTADKINGNYAETIDFATTTFNSSIVVTFASFVQNDGVTSLPGITTGLGNSYGLYALYTGSGTFGVSPTDPTKTEFIFTSSSFEFYYDDYTDGVTAFTDPGAGNASSQWGTSNADLLLASGGLTGPTTLSSNGGLLDNACSGANCGSFGITNQFMLTTAGSDFFIDPTPFYNVTLGSGNFNSFAAIPGTTQKANGSADISFQSVPEPTSIALLGLGLLGLSMRRQKQAK
jgi:hypothetical protein